MSTGKLQSLLHLLTEIVQQFAVHFDTFVFSCGILIGGGGGCVCVCVCVCVREREREREGVHARAHTCTCLCMWYCHISYSKENVTSKDLTAM